MKKTSAVRRGVLATVTLAVCLSSLAACGDDDEKDGEKKGDPSQAEITQDGLATIDEVTGCLDQVGLESSAIDKPPAGVSAKVEGVTVELPTDQFDDQALDLWVFESPDDVEANRLAITLAPIDTPSSVVKGNLVAKYVYPVTGEESWAQDVTDCIDAVTS